jgi:hypothetical protein
VRLCVRAAAIYNPRRRRFGGLGKKVMRHGRGARGDGDGDDRARRGDANRHWSCSAADRKFRRECEWAMSVL